MKIYLNNDVAKNIETDDIVLDHCDSYKIHELFDVYNTDYLKLCCNDLNTWMRVVMMFLAPYNIEAKTDRFLPPVMLCMQHDMVRCKKSNKNAMIFDIKEMNYALKRLIEKYSEGMILSLCFGRAKQYFISYVIGHKIDWNLLQF